MKNVLYFCLVLLLFACKEKVSTPSSEPALPAGGEIIPTAQVADEDALEALDWLLGDWQNTTGDVKMYEQWSKISNGNFNATSISVVANDTVFSETMRIHTENDSIYMTVIGAQEDKEQKVTFTLVSTIEGIFTFENKQHDFPQQIVYSNPSQDSLHAWIMGVRDDELLKSEFYFERVSE